MIVNFFYLSVYWATQVSKCIGSRFSFKKMRGLGNKHLENLRLESWNSGQNNTENATFSKNLNGGGHMSDTLIVNLASADWPEKGSWPRHIPWHFPMWVPPGYKYRKVITSYYAHILLIAMLLYFDRIIQDSKLKKQKYVYI